MTLRTEEIELFERDAEFRALARQLDAAEEGGGSLTLVEGPAGIGKTALLRWLLHEGYCRDMQILTSNGSELERDSSFGVVRQLIERPILEMEAEARERILRGPARSVKQILGIEDMAEQRSYPESQSIDFAHALYWVTANASESRPTLVIVDDAHWIDRASLLAGSYLCRRLEGLPVAVVAGIRTDAASVGSSLQTTIALETGAKEIRLGPLGKDGVRKFLERQLAGDVEDSLAQGCLDATGGNPFFLTELVAELSDGSHVPTVEAVDSFDAWAPASFSRTILARVDRLGSDAATLARTAAAMGGATEIRHLAQITGIRLDVAAEIADELVGESILETTSPVTFRHPLVLAAIMADVEGADSEINARAFQVLFADGASDEALVPHAMKARPLGNTDLVHVLRRSARKARLAGCCDRAATLLGRALAESPSEGEKGELLAELGHVEVRCGSFESGIGHLRAALSLVSDGPKELEILRDQAFAAFAASGLEEARAVVSGALVDRENSDMALQLEVDLAILAWLSGLEHGMDLARYRDVRGETQAERMILALIAQEGMATGMHPDEVVEVGLRALGNGRLIYEDTSESLSWYMIVYALITCEAFDDARRSIDLAVSDSSARGSAFARAGTLGARGELALAIGLPTAAEREAITVDEGGVPPVMTKVNAALRVRALVDQGRLKAAEEHMIKCEIDKGPGGPTALRWVPWARAVLRAAQGHIDFLRQDIQPIREDEGSSHEMRSLPWKVLLSEALSAQAPSEESRALAEEHLAWAKRWGKAGALGVAQRAHALAHLGPERLAMLRESVETLSASSRRLEEARTRLVLGRSICQVARHSAKSREGIGHIREAREIAMEVGARGLARSAGEVLVSAGYPTSLPEFEDLTTSERRIAELAAGGMTNKEIAQELFVTPKTVENHLTKVYAKLRIDSRVKLASVL